MKTVTNFADYERHVMSEDIVICFRRFILAAKKKKKKKKKAIGFRSNRGPEQKPSVIEKRNKA